MPKAISRMIYNRKTATRSGNRSGIQKRKQKRQNAGVKQNIPAQMKLFSVHAPLSPIDPIFMATGSNCGLE